MIELWGMSSPNVVKVEIALNELALPYEFRFVDVFRGAQFAPDFVAVSPNNKVPVLRDPQGPAGGPVTVFESGAILLYLAEKGGGLLSAEPVARLRELEWLMVQVSTVGPMFGQWNHFKLLAPAGEDYGLRRYGSERLRILEMLDRRLGEAEFLGGAYSLADVATFPWLRNMLGYSAPGETAETGLAGFPALTRWYRAVEARPAVAKALAANAEWRAIELAGRAERTADDMDRMLGRGRFERR